MNIAKISVACVDELRLINLVSVPALSNICLLGK
jgi:hypothetical protein